MLGYFSMENTNLKFVFSKNQFLLLVVTATNKIFFSRIFSKNHLEELFDGELESEVSF